jgi:hypothetical protein
MGYDFTIEYKRGHDNRAAVALSRQTEGDLLAISESVPHWIEPIQREVQHDPDLVALTEKIKQNAVQGLWHSHARLIYFKDWIYLKAGSPITEAIITKFHNSTHEGYQKGLQRIWTVFFWPRMKQQLHSFIWNCDTCQRHKADNT